MKEKGPSPAAVLSSHGFLRKDGLRWVWKQGNRIGPGVLKKDRKALNKHFTPRRQTSGSPETGLCAMASAALGCHFSLAMLCG